MRWRHSTLREVFDRLLTERLDPGRSALAVLVGITVGIIPIYGFQMLVAAALATVFGLNRPLTVGATFVNNPVLQPFILLGSLQLGSIAIHGTLAPITWSALTLQGFAGLVVPLLVGSVILSVLVGGAAAIATYVVMARRASGRPSVRERERGFRAWVNARFDGSPSSDRKFVRWKTRLDRLFAILLDADLGVGPVVDLGCGRGLSLALMAFRDPQRRLVGCDLDAARVEVARTALKDLDACVAVADVRDVAVPEAGLILIIDVLQYLDAAEQAVLLRRCASALLPGGRLIFRVPDTRQGFLSWTTHLFDRAIWWNAGKKTRPHYCAPEDYRQVMLGAGLTADMRRYRNRLPFSHLLVFATKRREAA